MTLLILLEHDFVAGFEVDFHSAKFLVEILAYTVDKSFAYIGDKLCPGVGGKVDGTAHRAAHVGTDFMERIALHRVGNIDTLLTVGVIDR